MLEKQKRSREGQSRPPNPSIASGSNRAALGTGKKKQKIKTVFKKPKSSPPKECGVQTEGPGRFAPFGRRKDPSVLLPPPNALVCFSGSFAGFFPSFHAERPRSPPLSPLVLRPASKIPFGFFSGQKPARSFRGEERGGGVTKNNMCIYILLHSPFSMGPRGGAQNLCTRASRSLRFSSSL